MALLRFSFGTMGSGKSTLALQIHHNLSRRNKHGLLLTKLDRAGAKVSSRLGISVNATQVSDDLNFINLVEEYNSEHGSKLEYLVCDECQFYSNEQVDQLALAVDDYDVDVYAFGLITDFRGLLFEGTKRLLEVADERTELHVEARCWCGSRATHNARLVNGNVVYEGDVVVVGDTIATEPQLFGDVVSYELLCRAHYRSGEAEPNATAQ